jgi:hypothetical protein
MKELQERAEMYAAEKMNELMTKAIAQAYEDGYRNGYKDRESDIVELDDTELDVEVCDLGLPSGTLWAQDYFEDEEGEQYFAYAKAAKLGLPTKEQVEELVENCKWQGDYSYSGMTFYYGICVGATGESIRFNSNGYMEGEECVHNCYGDSSAYFWIQDDEDGTEKNAVRIGGVSAGKPDIEIVKIFSGYKLPVLVVRK